MDDYDVFLSYSRSDVQGGFNAHLEEALRSARLNLLDKKSLAKGDHAYRSIDDALGVVEVHVAVVSGGYAESKYCHSELVAMMRSGNRVIPIFYDVQQADLHWPVENGPFAAAFEKHKSRGIAEEVEEWADALRKLAEIIGFCLSDYKEDEAELKREVVETIISLTSAYVQTSGVMGDYDVYLNHRGPDVQAGFIAHLDEAFRCAGLNPFLYMKSLVKEDAFRLTNDALEVAEVHVAVVSRRFAESRYCRSEIVAMMRSGKPVIPVFYKRGGCRLALAGGGWPICSSIQETQV